MTNTEPVHALNLDLQQQQSFVRYYRNLPEKPTTTIRFFNRSDFYTVHGEDATYASQQLFGTNTIKYMGEEPKLSYLVINRTNFEKFVRDLLLVKQYRVEVYVKSSQSKNNDWILEYKGSSGNLAQFEQILFDSEIVFSVVVMGIKLIEKTKLAVSCVNVSEGQFYVCELTDNEFFTELEALVAQINPKECIIQQGETTELVALKRVLERNGVLVEKIKKSEFEGENIFQDLDRLLYFLDTQQKNSTVIPETAMKEAMGSLHAVIKYLNLATDEQNYNQFKISTLDIHNYVRLDTAAVTALNLLPKPGVSTQSAAGKLGSILGMLDTCCTTQGCRLLEQWVKQPLRDINLITERLEIVETFLDNSEIRQTLRTQNLLRVPDLLLLAKKLGGKKASLQDCYRVYQAISSIPGLTSLLRKCNNKCVQAMLIDPISEFMNDLEKYQSMIEQTLDFDLVDRGEFFVKQSFDDELNELYQQKQEIEENMQKVLRHAARELDLEAGKNIKLECNDQHGYFFRVTLKEEPVLRKNKNFRIVDALKGGVRFTNNKLTSLNEAYSNVKDNYEQQQKTVVKEIIDVAAGYADTLRNLNMSIAKVDVLLSFANVAATAPTPFTKPKLYKEGTGILKLKQVRHPCLELQDGISFIPNDGEFEKDRKLLHIITGPNMGGKSTYIRSIGTCVLLAHIGSLVPCSEAEISLVDCILARVGADDSQLKGLSTFMLEMVETSSIIRSATSNSLVIIDELGRGTSTYDGCGIAWAITEYLAKEVKCFTLFATHFHEITQLAETIPTINNLHVTAVTTQKTITPLYQVKDGPCDKSYGIHCARMVGFPSDVVDFAVKQQQDLEDYQGMKYIKDFEQSLKTAAVEEGDYMIQQVFEECKKLDLTKLSDDELLSTVEKIKMDLLAKNNLFIKGLLDQ